MLQSYENTFWEQKKTNTIIFFNYFFSSVPVFATRSWEYHNTILTMSLLPFWALNMSVALLSMRSQEDLEIHQKYLNFWSTSGVDVFACISRSVSFEPLHTLI